MCSINLVHIKLPYFSPPYSKWPWQPTSSNNTIEHFGFREKIPVAVLELVGFQVHLAEGGEKDGNFICTRFLEHIRNIYPHKSIIDVFVFDGASNVQLDGGLLKIHYQKVSVMRGVEHTVSLFFKDFSKVPVVNEMITDHKEI